MKPRNTPDRRGKRQHWSSTYRTDIRFRIQFGCWTGWLDECSHKDVSSYRHRAPCRRKRLSDPVSFSYDGGKITDFPWHNIWTKVTGKRFLYIWPLVGDRFDCLVHLCSPPLIFHQDKMNDESTLYVRQSFGQYWFIFKPTGHSLIKIVLVRVVNVPKRLFVYFLDIRKDIFVPNLENWLFIGLVCEKNIVFRLVSTRFGSIYTVKKLVSRQTTARNYSSCQPSRLTAKIAEYNSFVW